MEAKTIINLLLLLAITLAASSESFVQAKAATLVQSNAQEHPDLNTDTLRILKTSKKEIGNEDSADTYNEDEERIAGLSKLKSIFQKNPDAALSLGKNSGLGKALAGNTDPAYIRANSQVRSYFKANPTMTRGLSLYQLDYMIAIVSLFVSIGALSVIIAIIVQRSNE